jgi:SAM-dependent methyltransferase
VQGDAEDLPFSDNEFDIVINVESSHNYPNLRRFFEEVARVLRPGGFFSHADVFTPDRYAVMTQCKEESPELQWLEELDISDYVKAAIRRRMEPNSLFRRQFRTGVWWPAHLVTDWLAMQSWGAGFLNDKEQRAAAATMERGSKLTSRRLAALMNSYRHTLAMKPR